MAHHVRMPIEKKVSLLTFIKKKKEILFGKFSSDIDIQKKRKSWGEVLSIAKSLKLVSENRDYVHVRDKLYGLWKARTLKKKENMGATGKTVGKQKVLNDVDLLILEILGKDTHIVNKILVCETSVPVPVLNSLVMEQIPIMNSSVVEQIPIMNSSVLDQIPTILKVEAVENPTSVPSTSTGIIVPCTTICSRQLKRVHVEQVNSMMETKKRQLEIELIEIKIYNQRLDAYRLEKELNLPLSRFTKSLFH